MGNILKLEIQHESPVSSLFLETGMNDLPTQVCIVGGDNQLGSYFRDGSGPQLILVLTYLLASFLTSAHPFPLELVKPQYRKCSFLTVALSVNRSLTLARLIFRYKDGQSTCVFKTQQKSKTIKVFFFLWTYL